MAEFADFYQAGNVPEDVIDALFDVSVVDRPYTGSISHMGSESAIKEWLSHELRKPRTDNVVRDGQNSGTDGTSQGVRYKQPMQLQDTNINMGDQALESAGYGNITDFATQLQKRTEELYRDLEARSLSEAASVLPVAGTTAGEQAGFFAQVVSAADPANAGGWNPGTGVFDSPTPAATRALAESQILGVLQVISRNGGRPNQLHLIPELKSKFSSFMMTSSSRVGVLVTQAPGGAGGATAVQSVQVYETDFGVLEVVNNQVMQPEVETPGSERANVAIVQTEYAECIDQWTPRAKRLGPSGAGENWQVTNSGGTILLNEKAHGAVRDIDYTLDMVA